MVVRGCCGDGVLSGCQATVRELIRQNCTGLTVIRTDEAGGGCPDTVRHYPVILWSFVTRDPDSLLSFLISLPPAHPLL